MTIEDRVITLVRERHLPIVGVPAQIMRGEMRAAGERTFSGVVTDRSLDNSD